MEDEQNWLNTETRSANFGDKRLKNRYKEMLGCLFNAPDKSIPSACRGWSETLAAYRFLNNDSVSVDKILEPHKEAALERIRKEKVVLIPQDTTEIDFTGRKTMDGAGYLSQENSLGFYLHPCVAFTPEKCCLGVVNIQTWTRDNLENHETKKQRTIEEKESHRWLKGYDAANEIALNAPDTQVISVSDREGDIYEVLEKLPSDLNKARWIIRCNQNRAVSAEGSPPFNSHLKEEVNASAPIGRIEFALPAGDVNRNNKRRETRKGRTVEQELRFATVYLRPPYRKGKKLASVPVNVVHCKEINVPEGETPIEWYLLTSCPVVGAESALEIVRRYLVRWQIEVFFKVLKSGCRIEELQFETAEATQKCLSMYMIVAWRILYITVLGRRCPEIDCELVFDRIEWQAVHMILYKTKPPTKVPSLREMIIMVAKLGGFLARKSDGFPGPKVMWIGTQRMRDFTLALEAFQKMSLE